MLNAMWSLLTLLYIAALAFNTLLLACIGDYKKFQSLSYGSELYREHNMAVWLAIVAILWNSIGLTYSLKNVFKAKYQFFSRRHSTYVIPVLCDLVLGVSFIVTATIQARYLPRPLGKCENLAQLDNLDDGDTNWLDVLISPERPDWKWENRENVCTTEIQLWKMEIVSAACSVVFILIRAVSMDWVSLLSDTACVVWVSSLAGTAGACVVAASTWIRYRNRRIQQENQMNDKLKQRIPMEVIIHQENRRNWRAIDRSRLYDTGAELGLQLSPLVTTNKSELSLIQVFNSYGMAKTVASECHYADFRNLMLVSKGIRFAVQNCMSDRLLKQITCTTDLHPGIATRAVPKDCWGCGNQICPSCAWLRRIPQDRAFHFQKCAPYCSRCFRYYFCYPRSRKDGSYRVRRSRWLPDTCLGHGFRPIPPDVKSFSSSENQVDVQPDRRLMCSFCKNTSWEVITARRGWRGWTKDGGNRRVLGPSKTTNITCLGCKKRIIIEKGQRVWWACMICNSECAEEFHVDECRAQCHGDIPQTLFV